MINKMDKTTVLRPSATLMKNFIWIIGFSLLTAAGAWIEIWMPFTMVPLTLQTLFVISAGAVLGPKKGALSQLTYLSYGIMGLPVFSGGAAGFFHLLGPTGGYLLAFPVSAFIAGLMVSSNRNWLLNVAGFTTASLVILFIGMLQFTLFTGNDINKAFALGFLPFIAGDFIKSVLASIMVKGMNLIKK
jgi:biotin transport system substrate-specific component